MFSTGFVYARGFISFFVIMLSTKKNIPDFFFAIKVLPIVGQGRVRDLENFECRALDQITPITLLRA